MDMCMEAFQEGRGMSNGVPLQGSANNNNFNPVYVASVDVPGSLYELAMDAIPVFEESFSNISNNTSAYNFPQQQQQQVTSFGSSPFPWQVLDPALLLCDPVWQRARFECPAAVDPMKMQYRELQNSFEERQAALAEQLVEMGRAYNNRNINNNIMRLQQLEAVQSVLETTNVPTEGHAINSLYENIGCNWRPIKIEPGDGSGAGAAVGYGAENSLQFNNYFAPLCDSPVSSSNSAIQLQQQRKSEKCRRESLNPGSAEVTVTGAYEGGGGWQCAITNQLLGYDSLPDLHTVNGDHASDSSNYQLIAMPPHTIFHALPPPTAQFTESSLPAFPLQEPQLSPVPAWQNQPKPSDSYAPIEPPAKRPRTSCYTLEDILKRLPRGAALGLRTIRSNESSPRNISPAPQFSSDLSLASPRLSCSGASSSLEKDYDEKQQQQYRKPSYASVEPQSIAARHRRKKISEKIRCLEKLIPGGCKLDTARMLEEAIKYVRFLQAQVHVLECMPSAESKDTRSNPAKDNRSLSLRSNIYKEGSWNVSLANALALQRSTLAASLLKKLSAQQMLHILVTSPTIQRKLFSAEKCVGTVEQKKMLVAAEALLSYDFSSFRHTDD